MNTQTPEFDRRRFAQLLLAVGVGGVSFQRALAAEVERELTVTPEMIASAEWIAGIELTEEERASTATALERALQDVDKLREFPVNYDVAPCLSFSAAPWLPPAPNVTRNQATLTETRTVGRPASDDDLAFLPVTELSPLLQTGQITSTELTKLYIKRLKQYDPLLKCVVTLTENIALQQAAKADGEISSGHYRGPLHGIPWGAKDLIAYPGYPTTWGATPFRDQTFDYKATVAKRLEAAGAVLVAKLSLGALAMGDKWFGGMTRNPWNREQGSSGSSAGSASAVVAGLVGFALGSETLGSIVSPCRRCGANGLRPTFGRVSRHGCMSLSWSMDKLGPITRSVEDCALVLDAIHGFDGLDATAVDQPFAWPNRRPLESLRVGVIETNEDTPHPALPVLKDLGVQLVKIKLPDGFPTWAVTMMLGIEAGAMFDRLTREHITEGLNSWPNTFRRAQFIPAVEYLRASRIRTKMMHAMRELMETIDLYVGGDDLGMTNLTGHPSIVIPHGVDEIDGKQVPRTIKFTGRLFGETELLAVAHAYQQATDFHLLRPSLGDTQ